MSRHSRGFTLYEMVLVLTITAGLAILLARPVVDTRSALNDRTFWLAWGQLWRTARQDAISHHRSLTVTIDANQRQIRVTVAKPTPRLLQSLPIPRQLRPPQSKIHCVITPRGWSESRTIAWWSVGRRCWWYQSFPIGGGMFHVRQITT